MNCDTINDQILQTKCLSCVRGKPKRPTRGTPGEGKYVPGRRVTQMKRQQTFMQHEARGHKRYHKMCILQNLR